MSGVVWKFALRIADVQTVSMPCGARVLSVAMQGLTPCLWALVDPDADNEARHFAIVGTGHTIKHQNAEYIGTVHTSVNAMPLVWHVFEVSP